MFSGRVTVERYFFSTADIVVPPSLVLPSNAIVNVLSSAIAVRTTALSSIVNVAFLLVAFSRDAMPALSIVHVLN